MAKREGARPVGNSAFNCPVDTHTHTGTPERLLPSVILLLQSISRQLNFAFMLEWHGGIRAQLKQCGLCKANANGHAVSRAKHVIGLKLQSTFTKSETSGVVRLNEGCASIL